MILAVIRVMRRLRSVIATAGAALLIGLVLLGSRANAQSPEIVSVMPLGAERGHSTTFNVEGHNLLKADALVSGPGLKVVSVRVDPSGNKAAVGVEVAADAALGPHDIRMASPTGVTTATILWVGSFPETTEIEPNDDAAHAQALGREPIVVNGAMQAAADEDMFSLDVRAGETWVFDCNAARIGSTLDPVLTLRDGAGRIITAAQSTWLHDPRLVYKFARSGRYFLSIHDSQFHGGPDYGYRLTCGMLPTITGFQPRGAEKGRSLTAKLQGINLTGTQKSTLDIPADPLGAAIGSATWGDVWTEIMVDGRPSLPIELLPSAFPVLNASDDDNTVVTPLSSIPVAVDGVFERMPHRRFSFIGKATQRLVFDLLGRRIGSRIDGIIRLLDPAGKEIANNDDAIGKDARLEATLPAAGLYTLEVGNVEEHCGPDCYYRLVVEPLAPDFTIDLDVDRIQVGAGGTVAATVEAARSGGFTGQIRLLAQDAPGGATLQGGIIATGRNDGEFTFTASESTPRGVSTLSLFGEAVIDGKTVRRQVGIRRQYIPRYLDVALLDAPVRYEYHPAQSLALAVIPRAEPFSLSMGTDAVQLKAGGKVDILVKANRGPNAKGEIKLEVRNAPDRVQVQAPSIAAGQTEAHVILTAPADLAPSVSNLIIQGKIDPAVQPAPAITLTVVH